VEVEDFITVSFRYSNGALGVMSISSCVPGAQVSGIRGTRIHGNRILGTEGQIAFEGQEVLVYTEKKVDGLEPGAWNVVPLSEEDNKPGYHTYFDRFSQAAMDGRDVDFPGEEGRKNLEIILAAYQSGQTHRPVDLPL
jgi:predicted dehydrogenase